MKALFEIGQKVVCVDSGRHKVTGAQTTDFLIEGKTYTVLENRPCKCGKVFISVGVMADRGSEMCACCGDISPTNGYWSHHQNRFVPLDFDRQADSEIKEALNKELLIR
jgi:hypothetical protein